MSPIQSLPPSAFHFERIAGLPSSTTRQSSAPSKYRWPRRPWMIWSLHSSRVTFSLCCRANVSVFVRVVSPVWTVFGQLPHRRHQMALVSTAGSTRNQMVRRSMYTSIEHWESTAEGSRFRRIVCLTHPLPNNSGDLPCSPVPSVMDQKDWPGQQG